MSIDQVTLKQGTSRTQCRAQEKNLDHAQALQVRVKHLLLQLRHLHREAVGKLVGTKIHLQEREREKEIHCSRRRGRKSAQPPGDIQRTGVARGH